MSPEPSVRDQTDRSGAVRRRRRRRAFWSLVAVLVLLPTMLWDAPLMRLRLATARKAASPMAADAGGAPASPRPRPRSLPHRMPVEPQPERGAAPGQAGAPSETEAGPLVGSLPDGPTIVPASDAAIPLGPVGGEPRQVPQILPLGPGTGPVVYPVAQPPEGPPTSPPVTVAPVSPDPDPARPPVVDPALPPGPDLPPIPAPAPVPEPSGWALMLLGAGLLGLALRKRAQYGRQAG